MRILFPAVRVAAALSFLVLAACGGSGSGSTAADTTGTVAPVDSTDVVTHHNDNARTGQNLTERNLTATNVAPSTFGLLRMFSVTGRVDSQPLYLSHLLVGGGSRNVVFIATEHGLVYAFDADTGTQLWQTSVMPTGESATPMIFGCGLVEPEIGITATPVIDRNAGPNGTMYLVAMSVDGSEHYHQRLHALDVSTGAEISGSPNDIQATYVTPGGVSSGFNQVVYMVRAALLLLDGVVYTTWTSHCDVLPYGGWVMGFDQTTLKPVSVLNLGPSMLGASVWQAAGGPAADSKGNIYVMTGNGAFDDTLDSAGFPASGDYGNSFVRLSTAGGTLAVADYFAMYLAISESSRDLDLGSSGPMVLPDEVDATGVLHQLIIGGGKDGNLYVVDRNNMSKYDPLKDDVYQVLVGATAGQVFAAPAYFNHTVYYGDVNHGSVDGALKAFTFSQGKLPAFPNSQTKTVFGYPGASPAVSANGAMNAIVWATENTAPAVLHAYDATNLATEFYNSEMAAGGRDRFGDGNKYITPVIADGKVFVASKGGVGEFGLLP
jgi:outer membrane protein assembly factor BamB